MGVNYGGSPGLFLYILKLTQNEANHSGKNGTDWNRMGGGGGNGVNYPEAPQHPSSVRHCRLGPGVGRAGHQARGWERRDKDRVQMSVPSDYVSPVLGQMGPTQS